LRLEIPENLIQVEETLFRTPKIPLTLINRILSAYTRAMAERCRNGLKIPELFFTKIYFQPSTTDPEIEQCIERRIYRKHLQLWYITEKGILIAFHLSRVKSDYAAFFGTMLRLENG